ncbi:hypothetical protein M0R45_019944 [Rubus argutus]|uniref:MULE transposase domain-containing protein n=1 Tax=Rubus argutus TaxID=59490 RepID=A0AAW1X7E0_RUBAR
MRTCSISTSRAYDYLVKTSGGFQFVGYTSKDLFNKIEANRRAKLINGDAQNVIDYMNEKATDDPVLCASLVLMRRVGLVIYSRETTSLYDFTCFGDVLVFDSTYKNNIYNRPLVVLVGTNNHRATTVFGFAIIVDETVDTYIWVLRTFLEAMKGKMPIYVLTDGDEAMYKAIIEVFSEAKHRLCTWHVGKNMVEKIKDDDIRKEFRHCMYSSLSTAEWDVTWQNLVQRIEEGEVSESLTAWLEMMYRKRER